MKLQLQTIETYRSVMKALQDRNTELHSYQVKGERTFRVVLRNLHHSTDHDELKRELLEKGHTAVNIFNVKHRATKQPLSMFYVNLAPKANNKDIYNITKLMHCVVKFEAPNSKREIPQCTRCQSFLHTKAFCRKTPRCVKCLASHLTKDCTRTDRNDAVRCTNCGQNHPANYRGCQVYKELQKKLHSRLRHRENQDSNNLEPTHITRGSIRTQISYADAVTRSERDRTNLNTGLPRVSTSTDNSSSDMHELKEMMKQLMGQMSTMLNLLTTVVSKLK